ncbi:hypothetical protein UlMin_009230 [Ulmus minor]
MKRRWSEEVDVLALDDSSSDSGIDITNGVLGKQSTDDAIDQPPCEETSEDPLIKRAEMYQDYMKQLPIPTHRGSIIPFTSWIGLGKSIKQLYGQPLHYLTNVQLKQWDQMRMGTEDEYSHLDTIIHPCKAEATIWFIEEIHRKTTSHHHVAKLWQSDPMYHAFIDSIFPQIPSAPSFESSLS